MKVLETEDRFGNQIELSQERWNHAFRHKIPGLEEMEECLKKPDEVRESKYDEEVNSLLYGFKRRISLCCGTN